MNEKFTELLKNATGSFKLTTATLRELIKMLGLTSSAEVVHIFDMPKVRKDLMRAGDVEVRYEYSKLTKLLDEVILRESIERVGVIHTIIVAPSPSNNRLWVLDGGTRTKAIGLDRLASWKVLNLDPEEDQLHALVAVAIGLNTLMTKWSRYVTCAVYSAFKPLYDKYGIDEAQIFGTRACVEVEESQTPKYNYVVKLADGFTDAKQLIDAMYEIPDETRSLATKLCDEVLSAVLSMPPSSDLLKSIYGVWLRTDLNVVTLAKTMIHIAGLLTCYRYEATNRNLVTAITRLLETRGYRFGAVAEKEACIRRLRALFTSLELDESQASKLLSTYSKISGGSPISYAAAIYCLATSLKKSRCAVQEVERMFGVSRVTIRNMRKKLGDTDEQTVGGG